MGLEEFVNKIKSLFVQSLNGTNTSIEDQIYNKKIVSIIERNIILSLYEGDNYNQLENSEDKKDYEKLMTSMISKRNSATMILVEELCNPKHFNAFHKSEFNSYDDIVNGLISNPQISYSEIFKDNQRLFDYETAKKIYDEILVPYYKMLGFPTRIDSDNIERPYDFCIIDFDTNRISESKSAELRQYYLERGYSPSIIEEIIRHPESGLAPSEVLLLQQYKEEKSKEHLKR